MKTIDFHFINNKTFEQITLKKELMGEKVNFLKEKFKS